MPVVTRSQSKKLQLKDENVQDSLTKKSLIHALYEIEFRRVILAENPEHYKQMGREMRREQLRLKEGKAPKNVENLKYESSRPKKANPDDAVQRLYNGDSNFGSLDLEEVSDNKQIYGNKVEVSKQGSVDQLIKDLCLLIVLIFKVLFYGTKKN